MHVVLLNQFYPPDIAPTGRYLHDLACELTKRGHQVEVVSSTNQYADKKRSSRWQKAWTFLKFYLTAYRKLSRLNPAPDLVVSLTTPPFVGLIAKNAIRRKPVALVHWVMDVYPDVLVADGMMKGEGRFHRFFRWLAMKSYRQCAGIIALGEDMATRLKPQVAADTPVHVIPLWTDLKEVPAVGANDGPCCFQYSGNMGRGHDLIPFLDTAVALGPDPRLRWHFAGEGPRKADVVRCKEAHPELPIKLSGYVPEDALLEHQRQGDVHLVSMRPGWEGCILPSKLQAAFACARPVIFVGPMQSSPAQWILTSGGGWVVDPEQGEDLGLAVTAALDPDERIRRGIAARDFARTHFSPVLNLSTLCDILEAS